jgi:sugar/nucleoside kinase (ribokinase family)
MTQLFFTKIIGTGGIGTGVLFLLEGDRTLERSESRQANLSDARDYCKQHIILHYVARTLSGLASIFAIGMVGADAQGKRMKAEMDSAGIDTGMVAETEEYPTMYSICLQYPDNTVCNVTAKNSACTLVTESYIVDQLSKNKMKVDEKTIILAAPEVPVAARLALLRIGAKNGAFCVASLVVDEAKEFIDGGGLQLTDLLALNETEARAVAGIDTENDKEAIECCCEKAYAVNPEIHLVITCGSKGSYSFYNRTLEYIPPIDAKVVSTAGAGDAYLSGVICGFALGLPFQHVQKTDLRATDLGNFFATESVGSIHSISETFQQQSVREFLRVNGGCNYDL